MNERTRFSGRWDAGGGGRRLIGRLGMIGVMALGMAGASLFGGGAQTAFASGIILGGGGGGGGGSATSTTTTLAVTSPTQPSGLPANSAVASVGQPVTFTATVSPAPGGGTVTFTDGATILCNLVTVSNDTATCAITYTSVGGHAISAIYNSDTNYSGSTSNTVTLTVNKASTATTLAVTNPAQPSGLPAGSAVAVVGQQVTFTATVKPAPDGGTVTFTDGATILCSQVAVSNGKATCSVTESSAGSHSITASYSGDNNYTPSVSFDLTLYVDTNISKYLQNGVYDLRDINLSNGYFVGENLSGANLSNGKFSGANFSYANLSGASLSNGNFSYANFTGANLSAANLTQTNLKGATGLGSATLADVTWNMTTCPDNTDSNTDGGTCVGHL